MAGKLIVFEGIDGSGKGTVIKRAYDFLVKEGFDVHLTKDPGGTDLGAEIRKILFETITTHRMAPGVCDLLFLASHVQNSWENVEPALEAGVNVLSDRWWISQMVYMEERECPEPIKNAYRLCHGREPDLTVLLTGDPKALFERAKSRTSELHQEAKAWNNVETQSRIQKGYVRELTDSGSFYYHVDTTRLSIDEVSSAVNQILLHFLKNE